MIGDFLHLKPLTECGTWKLYLDNIGGPEVGQLCGQLASGYLKSPAFSCIAQREQSQLPSHSRILLFRIWHPPPHTQPPGLDPGLTRDHVLGSWERSLLEAMVVCLYETESPSTLFPTHSNCCPVHSPLLLLFCALERGSHIAQAGFELLIFLPTYQVFELQMCTTIPGFILNVI